MQSRLEGHLGQHGRDGFLHGAATHLHIDDDAMTDESAVMAVIRIVVVVIVVVVYIGMACVGRVRSA